MGKVMNKEEKISWLLQNHPAEYMQAKAQAEAELDELTPMFCFCGKLATGWHTNHCKQFQDRLKSMIINCLKPLLP